MFTNLPYIILQAIVMIGMAAFGAEFAIGSTNDPELKVEFRQKKKDFFKQRAIELFTDAKGTSFPSWLADFLIGMIERGDAIPSFFVSIANFRNWFGKNGVEGNLL